MFVRTYCIDTREELSQRGIHSIVTGIPLKDKEIKVQLDVLTVAVDMRPSESVLVMGERTFYAIGGSSVSSTITAFGVCIDVYRCNPIVIEFGIV